jgi:carbonic anhydrase
MPKYTVEPASSVPVGGGWRYFARMTVPTVSPTSRVVPVFSTSEIFPEYRGTPVERLFAYHNLKHPAPAYDRAEMLISMCMDSRKRLEIPDNFAFVIRTAAGNLRDNEFRTAFAIGVGGVRAIAIIAHTDCGMVRLSRRRQQFVEGMVKNAGWSTEDAARYFDERAPRFEIASESDFVVDEAQRIRKLYPAVLVAPLLYRVETGLLYLLRE